jgi:hypothetical protein
MFDAMLSAPIEGSNRPAPAPFSEAQEEEGFMSFLSQARSSQGVAS